MQRHRAMSVFLVCLGLFGCQSQDGAERAESGTGGVGKSEGGAGSGGVTGSGGASARGGASGRGGSGGSTGAGGAGGSIASGGATASGGASKGGSSGSGGAVSSGGLSSGGRTGSGGNTGTGGRQATGGSTGLGGSSATGGTTTPGSSLADCPITVKSAAPSSKMGTVGVVEWSTSLSNLTSAKIVYTLNGAGANVLNKGGTAPVDLTSTGYRTLLLGLKPSSTYTFHIEVTTSGGGTCKSADGTLTTTTLSGAPTITSTVAKASAQANGFIVSSSMGGGMGGGGTSTAFIIDADGAVVWAAAAPSSCSRARMDYEGVNMWMVNSNPSNGSGEMRFVSMDGQTSKTNVSGLSAAHHDFAVMPGKIAAMVWVSAGGRDPESNLVEVPSDGSGTPQTMFKIGSNLYTGGGSGGTTYHSNSILYHPDDDSFTISDRNPNMYVKVKHDGTPVWQIGGSCSGAKAPKCAAGTWQVNHGHHLLDDGNMLIFNNGSSGSSHVLELKLTESASALSFTTVKDFTSGNSSSTLGDVQRLPNGNTLITYSNGGVILEVDPSWATVQTIKGSFGYAEWRESLYGPPNKQ